MGRLEHSSGLTCTFGFATRKMAFPPFLGRGPFAEPGMPNFGHPMHGFNRWDPRFGPVIHQERPEFHWDRMPPCNRIPEAHTLHGGHMGKMTDGARRGVTAPSGFQNMSAYPGPDRRYFQPPDYQAKLAKI